VKRKERQDIMNKINSAKGKTVKQTAFAFVVLMGIVSMFSDMTHESAASIMGAYLSLAGASAATIGFVSGLGELIGYSLRLVTGIFTDKTQKYWTMTILGYVIDCMAIPALALVPKDGWIWACGLLVMQRTGKAIKKPAKDTILSFAATQTGAGRVLLFVIMLMKSNEELFSVYSFCFAILGIPALSTVLLLLFAKRKYPNPEEFEPAVKGKSKPFHMNKAFVFYMIGISFFASGFLDFPMITLHTLRSGLIPRETLPLLYAGAMAVDAFAALFFGNLFDKKGVNVLILSTVLAAPFAIFIFTMNSRWALFMGVILWGIGMGAEESILKAAVTKIVSRENRSSGFGVFQTAFGICWFLGSWLMGILYDRSPWELVIFSVVMQLAAVPFFWLSGKTLQTK
jgi:MFS family permease